MHRYTEYSHISHVSFLLAYINGHVQRVDKWNQSCQFSPQRSTGRKKAAVNVNVNLRYLRVPVCWGWIPHVCCDSMLVQAVVPFLYPAKLRLSSPSSSRNVFLGQQADQTSPLPPAPIPPPTHSLLPHVLLSVNVPIILHASLISFSRPFVLLMLRPHRRPGPAHPR